VQVSTLRVRAIGRLEKPPLRKIAAARPGSTPRQSATREAYCFAKRSYQRFGIYQRAELSAGDRIEGPAIVDEGTSTTVIHSDQQLSVDAFGNLLIRRSAA
jgi:N-methylhydantoinase A